MNISYSFDKRPSADQIIALYDNAGLPRPTNDKERIQKMFDNSNLIVTAWDNDVLVGVSRSITDWVWACYLSDLAVRHEYKKVGIGRQPSLAQFCDLCLEMKSRIFNPGYRQGYSAFADDFQRIMYL